MVIYADTFLLFYYVLLVITLLIHALVFNLRINMGRILLGALAGDVITFVAVVVSVDSYDFVLAVVIYVLCLVLVYEIAFEVGRKGYFKGLLKGSMFLFLTGLLEFSMFITVMGLFEGIFGRGLLMCLLLFIMQLVLLIIFCLAIRYKRNSEDKAYLVLELSGKEFIINGLIDSGNLLRTGDGSCVTIVSERYLKEIGGCISEQVEILAYTVSGERLLKGGSLENVTIKCADKKDKHFDKFWIAFSKIPEKSDYEAIIPKQLLKEI